RSAAREALKKGGARPTEARTPAPSRRRARAADRPWPALACGDFDDARRLLGRLLRLGAGLSRRRPPGAARRGRDIGFFQPDEGVHEFLRHALIEFDGGVERA